MFQKIKPHLKWVIPLVVIVILLVLFVVSQNSKIISATVSPEVIIKGQNQEITITAVIKPRGIIPPVIFVTLSEPKKVEDYNTFKGNSTWLGLLKKSTKDNSGNYIYQRTFNLNHSKAETVQVQLRNFVGFFIYPTVQTDSTIVWPITLPTLRLAVTTRSFSLPQDPGEEGKKTLAGVDSDNDGVRDDIQREIFFAFPESERVRKALGLQWSARQNQIENSTDKDIVDIKEIQSYRATTCLYGVLNDIQHQRYEKVLRAIENVIYNTTKRGNGYDQFQKIVKLQPYQIPNEGVKNCDFDWQSLPD